MLSAGHVVLRLCFLPSETLDQTNGSFRVMIFVSFTTFRETYAPVILKRRADRVRRTTGSARYHTADDGLHANKTVFLVLSRALSRPVRLLIFHPLVQLVSFAYAFYYGVLYIVLATFSQLWTLHYHESVAISGLHYISLAAGEIAATAISGPLIDILYRRLKARHGREPTPEDRIPLMLPGALLAPVGLLIYGWTAEDRVQWAVVDIGMFVAAFGMQIATITLQAYTIDSYPDHASSASAARQFLSSLTAFSFPLFAPRMYSTLGYGWGNSLIAFVALGLGLLMTWLIRNCGARLRAKKLSTY